MALSYTKKDVKKMSSFALSALSVSKLLVVGMYVSFVSSVPVSGLDFKIPVFGCISKIYSRLLIKAGLGLRRDFFAELRHLYYFL